MLDGNPVYVSWSHSGDTLCAVASFWPTGCDIERLAEEDFDPRDSSLGADGESSAAEFRVGWSTGEALGKLASALQWRRGPEHEPEPEPEYENDEVKVWCAGPAELGDDCTARFAFAAGAERIAAHAVEVDFTSGPTLRAAGGAHIVSKAATVSDALTALPPAGRSASSWITRPSSRASS